MKVYICCLVLCLVGLSTAKRYEPNWESLDKRPLPAWFDKAKIGIFLHWGVFSVPAYGTGASEWMWAYWRGHNKALVNYMDRYYKPNFTYPEFAPQFTAELFDAQKWAALFKKAGARYVVLTSKHHEGYTLWPSKYSFNWNAMDVGPRRDLVGELAKAVRDEKLTFGLYYSMLEWYHPVYNNDRKNKWQTQDFVKNKYRPEIEDLVNTYHPEVIWSDGDWENPGTYWNSTDFLAWLYNDSPVKETVVVNDRWGKGLTCSTHGDFLSCKDRFEPGQLQKKKWESAMTLDKASWGFRRNAQLNDYLSIEHLISFLASTISCGGNLLINVGPTSYGTIAPIFEERLTQLGEWLGINGEAIYESHPWTHQNDTVSKDLWYTQRESHVYAIVLKYEPQVVMGAVDPAKVTEVQLLGVKHKVEFAKNEKGPGLVVHFPPLTPNDHVKYAYTFKLTMKV